MSSAGGDGPHDAQGRKAALQRTLTWTRYSTIGVQFTGAALFFAWVGYRLDLMFGSDPWGLVSGLVLGFGGATLWLYYKVFPERRTAASGGTPDRRGTEDSGS